MFRQTNLRLNRSFRPRTKLMICVYGFIAGFLIVYAVGLVLGRNYITCGLRRAHREQARPLRLRRDSDEGGTSAQEKFLFVGILTAKKFLDTRAMASNKTWAYRVPGKVVFFLEKGEKYEGDLNVVQLEGIKEDDYPPQKKSFAMLQYVAKHFVQDYKWIVRADDDLYIKVNELVKFLKSVDDRKPYYIGQPGYGNLLEKGKLGLSGAYCMGGPGIILSSSMVQALSPHMPSCLNSTITDHEDTELGRCIAAKLNRTCTSSLEMKELFIHKYQQTTGKNKLLELATFGHRENKALTIHPMKDSSRMFQMENYFNNQTLQKLKVKERTLTAEIDLQPSTYQSDYVSDFVTVNEFIPQPSALLEQIQRPFVNANDSGVSAHYKTSYYHKTTAINDMFYIWDFLKYRSLYSVFFDSGKLDMNIFFKGRRSLLTDTQHKLQASPIIKQSSPGVTNVKFLNISYQSLRPQRGTEELVFMENFVQNKTRIVRPIYIRRRFPKHLLEFTESLQQEPATGNQEKTIYILLSVYKRWFQYKNFLYQHQKAVEGYRGKVVLKVSIFCGESKEHQILSDITDAVLGNNSHLDIRTMFINETFNRAKGMMYAMQDLDNSSLLLFIDVDMEYTSDFLQRVSRNTVKGHTTFFPVVFSFYNPKTVCFKQANCDLDTSSRQDDLGMWRYYGFGIASIYKEDLLRAGGFIVEITGWGFEDVNLYEKLIALRIQIVRSADRGIIHKFHIRECSMLLPKDQYIACIESGDDCYGSVRQLRLMYENVFNQSHI